MLQADIGYLAVIYDGRFLRCQPDAHLFYLFSSQLMLFLHVFHRIERRLDRHSRAPFLDIRPRHLVSLAKLINQPIGIRLRPEGHKEIIWSGKHIIQTRPARMDHHRGGDSVARRPACKVESLFNMIGVAVPESETRRLLTCIIEQPSHLPGIQTSRAARGGRRTKRGGNAMCTPVTCVFVGLGAQGHRHARPYVIAQRHGTNEMHSVDAELFRRCERGGHHCATWVRLRRSM